MRRCCVSKARPRAVAVGSGAITDEDAPLAAELRSLKLSQLLSRAMSTVSLSEDQIQQAQDSEEPRTALVDLLLEAQNTASRSAEQRLRDELRGLRLTALSKRAGVSRLSDTAIADAIDSEDPKGALIDLVVQAELLTPLMDGLNSAELMALPAPSNEPIEYDGVEVELLQSLSLKDLRKRAKAEGMSATELEEAMDADDPDEIFIGFLLQKQKKSDSAESTSTDVLAMELRSLSLKDLRKRAKAEGMSATELEEAMDADDPDEIF
eukprot:COSAG02_NODE_4067_length_5836_cov_18.100924_7_plen_265_part_01